MQERANESTALARPLEAVQKRSLASTLAIAAADHIHGGSPLAGAGFVDSRWRRRTHIETTSGIKKRLTHTLMMVEAGPAVLGPLFLEVNAGVLSGMIAMAALHELAVWCDLVLRALRRLIPAGEQITHTLLEAPPFLAAAAATTHWEQFRALAGAGRERPRAGIQRQSPAIPRSHAWTMLAALGLLGAVPHADELRRCLRAAKQGRIGHDTPSCLPRVFKR